MLPRSAAQLKHSSQMQPGLKRTPGGQALMPMLYKDNGKENGNYYSIWVKLGLHRKNGKENGNYCLGFRVQPGALAWSF